MGRGGCESGGSDAPAGVTHSAAVTGDAVAVPPAVRIDCCCGDGGSSDEASWCCAAAVVATDGDAASPRCAVCGDTETFAELRSPSQAVEGTAELLFSTWAKEALVEGW